MFCVNCGSKVDENWKFCNMCGQALVSTEQAPAETIKKSSAWIPDKTYNIQGGSLEEKRKWREIQTKSELGQPFYLDNFVILEDGTQIGFIYGHIDKYKGSESFYYNLYKLTPSGEAIFLKGGLRSGIESLYVLNGVAYCQWFNREMKWPID